MYQQVQQSPLYFQRRAKMTGIYKCFSPLLWKHTFMPDAGRINEIVSGYLRSICLILKRSLMCDLKTKRAWWWDKAVSLYFHQVSQISTFSHQAPSFIKITKYFQQFFFSSFLHNPFSDAAKIITTAKLCRLARFHLYRDPLKLLYLNLTLKFWFVSISSHSRLEPGAGRCKHSAFSQRGNWLKLETSRER